MEIVVRKTEILRELQLFQGIVERKNTIPILANVLMEADGHVLHLLATDLEVGLRSRCEASVTHTGALTLPAKKLYEIVKALPDTDIRIEEDKGGVKVAADRFDSRMQTFPREDFPSLPESGRDEIVLGSSALRQMVAKTQFAITGEDTRYFLNGALLVVRPDQMLLVSTDGHRLAMMAIPREGAKSEKHEDGETRVILPKKTLSELGRLLGNGEEEVGFSRSENNLFFRVGQRTLISRMIDGQFPAYERVIPKNSDKRVEFDRDRLKSAVSRVALLSNERSRAVRFSMAKEGVEITSSSPEFGEAKEVLLVDYAAAPVQICFNAQYVLDFLSAVDVDTVTLDFKDEMSQAVLRPAAANEYEYTYVVMPMRI